MASLIPPAILSYRTQHVHRVWELKTRASSRGHCSSSLRPQMERLRENPYQGQLRPSWNATKPLAFFTTCWRRVTMHPLSEKAGKLHKMSFKEPHMHQFSQEDSDNNHQETRHFLSPRRTWKQDPCYKGQFNNTGSQDSFRTMITRDMSLLHS